MNVVQLLILLVNASVLLLSLFKVHVPNLHLVYGLCVLITILPTAIGYVRLGRFPLYLISFVIFLLTMGECFALHIKISDSVSTAFSILGLFVLIMALYLHYKLPLIQLPKPTGLFNIGTISYCWKDTNKKEKHSPNTEEHRELLVQIWYPSDNTQMLKKTPYLAEVVKFAQKDRSARLYIPAHIFNDFMYTTTNSAENAPISHKEESYPVILFSHGLGGVCNINTSNIEELVSHGYIVIGINHTHASYVSHLSEGRVIPLNEKYRLSLSSIIKDNLVGQVHLLEQELETWVSDVSFVMTMLENINKNKNESLGGKFDFNRLGIFGHSLGGALAAEVCRRDDRFKAGVSLDGSIMQQTAQGGFKKPFMFIVGVLLGDSLYPSDKKLASLRMSKEDWDLFIQRYKDRIRQLCKKIGREAYYISIYGAGHLAFTDISLIYQFVSRCFFFDIGFIESSQITGITNSFLLKFFDKHLKLKQSNLTDQNYEGCTIMNGLDCQQNSTVSDTTKQAVV